MASKDGPAEENVREVRLLDLERLGSPDSIQRAPQNALFKIFGTLDHAPANALPPVVTLHVQGYGYGN